MDQLNLEVKVTEKMPKHCWENANDEEKENFRGTLQQLLENLNPPTECLHCKYTSGIFFKICFLIYFF